MQPGATLRLSCCDTREGDYERLLSGPYIRDYLVCFIRLLNEYCFSSLTVRYNVHRCEEYLGNGGERREMMKLLFMLVKQVWDGIDG